MAATQAELELLDLLRQHEDVLHELYSVYGSRPDELSELWSGLASDEARHAAGIQALRRKVEEGEVSIARGRFSADSLRNSLEYAKGEVARAKRGGVNLEEALATARDLEEALIERKFYEVFEGDDPVLARLLRRLAAETDEHRRRVQAAWEQHHRGE